MLFLSVSVQYFYYINVGKQRSEKVRIRGHVFVNRIDIVLKKEVSSTSVYII